MRGTLLFCVCSDTLFWDHPRVCGEHLLSPVAPLAYAGSSPRMRGTLDGVDRLAGSEGIIPAYAGNTWTIRPARPPRRDHPRVCGEHAVDVAVVASVSGSSPRMRGTHVVSKSVVPPNGIIPAYAGNTLFTSQLLQSL